ncbi:MAG: IMP cyclohydrolase [archaeon]|nr:IMP cyclohydrolase [archaeon]
MYVGRIVSIGMNTDGKPFIAYRVSSRSFPNRQCLAFEDKAAIVPKEGFETDIYKNSYIAYNCVKIVDDMAIVSNGSHTDVITDKIAVGMNIRDALAYSLLTMDYEKDDYNTPRIAGVVTSSDNEDEFKAFIGIVADNKLLVEEIPYGKAAYISTYGDSNPTFIDFDAVDSEKGAKFIFDEGAFEELEKPVNSVAAIFNGKWDIVSFNP